MRSRSMRLATAALVAAACVWTAAQGIGIIRYQIVLESKNSDVRNAELLNVWAATPGLASEALEALLRVPLETSELDGLKARADLLTRLLSIKPGASQAWISLATVRHARPSLPAVKTRAPSVCRRLLASWQP